MQRCGCLVVGTLGRFRVRFLGRRPVFFSFYVTFMRFVVFYFFSWGVSIYQCKNRYSTFNYATVSSYHIFPSLFFTNHPIILLLHWLYGICRTQASGRISLHLSLSLAIFLQPLTPVFFRSFSTLSNHLFLGFLTDIFLVGYS